MYAQFCDGGELLIAVKTFELLVEVPGENGLDVNQLKPGWA
jgi:hypothetical protein